MSKKNKFGASSEKQAWFLQSEAQITVFGGSAGSGKTYQGLLRHLKYVKDKNYVGYVIRKHSTALKGNGGAWDEALRLYSAFCPEITFTKQPMVIYFPSGAKIQFVGLDGEAGKLFFQGLQVSGCMVDEGTHNLEDEMWWIVSRLRTSAKMSPNLWITCNPDPDSFLFNWIEWYLFPKGHPLAGRPNPERNGQLRWYMRVSGVLDWAATKEELLEKNKDFLIYHEETGDLLNAPQSFRFIGATCHDNPIMLRNNPNYIASLLNMGTVEAERLYYGNWLARPEAAGHFKRNWVTMLKVIPIDDPVVRRVRCWDLAFTLDSEKNPDPDWTVGVLMAKTKSGKFIVEDVVRERRRAGAVYDWIAEVALKDFEYYGVFDVYIPEDPASGKVAAHYAVLELSKKGVMVRKIPSSPNRSKLQRFTPFSAGSESGLVYVIEGKWNEVYFSELEAFDGTRNCGHDDQADATSDAYNKMATNKELPRNLVFAQISV